MSDLREQMRRARESWFTHGAHEFLIRRPTTEQLVRWSDLDASEMLGRCVVGWRGVRVIDLVPGGTVGDAPFDADAFIEWISDDLKLLEALATEVRRRVVERSVAQDTAEKN